MSLQGASSKEKAASPKTPWKFSKFEFDLLNLIVGSKVAVNSSHNEIRKKWNGVPKIAPFCQKWNCCLFLANRQKRTPHGKRCQFGCQIYINFSVKLIFLQWQLSLKLKTYFFWLLHNSKTSQLLQELSLQLRGILKLQLTSFYAATVGELLSRNSHLK